MFGDILLMSELTICKTLYMYVTVYVCMCDNDVQLSQNDRLDDNEG